MTPTTRIRPNFIVLYQRTALTSHTSYQLWVPRIILASNKTGPKFGGFHYHLCFLHSQDNICKTEKHYAYDYSSTIAKRYELEPVKRSHAQEEVWEVSKCKGFPCPLSVEWGCATTLAYRCVTQRIAK